MTTRGQTLLELAVVLALAALLAMAVFPPLTYALDRSAVESATRAIVLAHREARTEAATRNELLLLTIAPDTLILRPAGGGPPLWARRGPARLGVTVTGPTKTLRFIPFGYTIGASNASWTLRRGHAERRVVVSRLGRVRVE
ncbi:MAG TPA: GspH/FimT family pseudopilin [Gemmatimonadales bacterium]|jgi:prepilin-type N-terminal cleavage/methylation domain-containing protein|nr:GspH/FimT family pseudopilin [Gemmatimonadales bacterium]